LLVYNKEKLVLVLQQEYLDNACWLVRFYTVD